MLPAKLVLLWSLAWEKNYYYFVLLELKGKHRKTEGGFIVENVVPTSLVCMEVYESE